MASTLVIYMKAQQNAKLSKQQVCIRDVASVYCKDKTVTNRVNAIQIHYFGENKEQRKVISVLKMIEQIEAECPAVQVNSIGEMDTVIEYTHKKQGKLVQNLKIILVAAVSFCGTALTIMAFHNDIGIHDVFSKLYELVTGQPSGGYTILEISYSVGLMLGIVLFFNHIGQKRFTKDPTPIEVEMRIYEQDVNKALVDESDREGSTIDVS